MFFLGYFLTFKLYWLHLTSPAEKEVFNLFSFSSKVAKLNFFFNHPNSIFDHTGRNRMALTRLKCFDIHLTNVVVVFCFFSSFFDVVSQLIRGLQFILWEQWATSYKVEKIIVQLTVLLTKRVRGRKAEGEGEGGGLVRLRCALAGSFSANMLHVGATEVAWPPVSNVPHIRRKRLEKTLKILDLDYSYRTDKSEGWFAGFGLN